MGQEKKIALSITAHPDDAEFLCVGTMALLKERGYEIHIATVANGDCGTEEYPKEQIARIRKQEAVKAAKVLDGTYHCLESGDIFVMYDRETIIKTIELIRKVKPTIVLANSPQDYIVDHTTSSKLAMTGCFCCGMPNIETAGVELYNVVPYLYYLDPVEGKDIFGKNIQPSMAVDITGTIDIKEKMLCCHESQRNWLLAHHGMDKYTVSMKEFSAARGELIGCDFAEGFRQHLGHAFSKDNILKAELGELVHKL